MSENADHSSRSDGSVAAALSLMAEEMRASREASEQARRRERRGVWLRRGFYLLLVVLLVGSTLIRPSLPSAGPYIARLSIVGTITNDPERDRLIERLAEDSNVRAVIVRIDSPGGTTVGGEALYQSLRRLAERKPVVAVMGEVAASAAYMAAVAADHIVARNNTITGSVGVIFTAPNISGALETLGVSVVELRSGEEKATPSPFQPVEEGGLELEQALIGEIFEWFVALVEERRDLSPETVAMIRDGRVVIGRTAAELNLVDEIGGEEAALAWLEANHQIDADTRVRERRVERRDRSLLSVVLDDLTGASRIFQRVEDAFRGPAALSQLR